MLSVRVPGSRAAGGLRLAAGEAGVEAPERDEMRADAVAYPREA